jgi:hypothetical protein
MNAARLVEIKAKHELSGDEKRVVHESLTAQQKDWVLWLSYGCTGVQEVKERPGTWIVFDTADFCEFDFDPRKLLGPLTAYEIPRVEDL